MQATARKEGLTGVQFKDVAGLGPILNEVLEVVEVGGAVSVACALTNGMGCILSFFELMAAASPGSAVCQDAKQYVHKLST
jgi:hypothetical protein